MGLRASFDVIEEAAPAISRVGVRRIEYADDGSVSAIEFHPPSESATPVCDPHPEGPIDAETVDEMVARECAFLEAIGR